MVGVQIGRKKNVLELALYHWRPEARTQCSNLDVYSKDSAPPLFVGGILKLVCSTNGCIVVNEYVIDILKTIFYNRIRKRFLIKNEVKQNAENR